MMGRDYYVTCPRAVNAELQRFSSYLGNLCSEGTYMLLAVEHNHQSFRLFTSHYQLACEYPFALERGCQLS